MWDCFDAISNYYRLIGIEEFKGRFWPSFRSRLLINTIYVFKLEGKFVISLKHSPLNLNIFHWIMTLLKKSMFISKQTCRTNTFVTVK